MMPPALLAAQANSGRRHASEDDYAGFLRARSTPKTVVQMLRRRRWLLAMPSLYLWCFWTEHPWQERSRN
jgi:hypothetical protein